jgi:hypothetical protein
MHESVYRIILWMFEFDKDAKEATSNNLELRLAEVAAGDDCTAGLFGRGGR